MFVDRAGGRAVVVFKMAQNGSKRGQMQEIFLQPAAIDNYMYNCDFWHIFKRSNKVAKT